MEHSSEIKIWRYMDLVKFCSLLTTESLYFACPLDFNDPYEGFLPRSHIEALSKSVGTIVNDIKSIRNQIADQVSDTIALDLFDDKIYRMSMLREFREASSKFGVSCWHKNEYESEAMWKLYTNSGQGIAIESTIKQLKLSLENVKGLVIDSVRYMDFDKDPIEKGHKHYGLFLKRESFKYEQELRTTILLPEEGKGAYVKCNLNTLITQIHVSPFMPPYFRNVVEAICLGKIRCLEKPIIHSKLFSTPDYGIKFEKDMTKSMRPGKTHRVISALGTDNKNES